jgi:hypothetical protein
VIHDRVNQLDKTKSIEHFQINLIGKCSMFPETALQDSCRIERAVGKLKRFKRIALRCEKQRKIYSNLVVFACGLLLVESVHMS